MDLRFSNFLNRFLVFLFIVGSFVCCKKAASNGMEENTEGPFFSDNTSYDGNLNINSTNEGSIYAIVNDNAVRIRDKPDLEGKIIGQLDLGMTVMVLGRSPNRMKIGMNNSYWIKIVNNRADGWIYGAYLDLSDEQFGSLPVLSFDKDIFYFSEEFLENHIAKSILSISDVIFEEDKSGNLKTYYSGKLFYDSENRFIYNSDTILRYLDYVNYNIILITQKTNEVEHIRDYLFIQKTNPETYLTNAGGIEIDGELSKWEMTVVVNHHWQGRFTEDVSQAFMVDMAKRKIMEISFNKIRLYSEL